MMMIIGCLVCYVLYGVILAVLALPSLKNGIVPVVDEMFAKDPEMPLTVDQTKKLVVGLTSFIMIFAWIVFMPYGLWVGGETIKRNLRK